MLVLILFLTGEDKGNIYQYKNVGGTFGFNLEIAGATGVGYTFNDELDS